MIRFLSEVNQFGDGLSLHLLHDSAAVNLDRLERGPSLEGNIFTHHSFGDESKNFQFSRRQSFDASLYFCYLGFFLILNYVF